MDSRGGTTLELGAGDLVPAIAVCLRQTLERARVSRAEDNIGEALEALGRASSLVRLLRPLLSRSARRPLEIEIDEARRRLESSKTIAGLTGVSSGTSPAKTNRRDRNFDFEQAISHLEKKIPSHLTCDDLSVGLKETYRDARRARKRAQNFADPEHLRQLYLRATDLRNQLELVVSIPSTTAKKSCRELTELSESLWKATALIHAVDLAIERAESRAAKAKGTRRSESSSDALERAARKQTKKALKLAVKRLADKPKKFIARLGL